MRRALFTLLVLVFPIPLIAQNEVGVLINTAQFRSTTQSDPDGTMTLKLGFGQQSGYGVSYNRFWRPNLSTEFAAQQIRGEAKISLRSDTETLYDNLDIGGFRSNVLSAMAQWHFAQRSVITPYVGAGVAYFTGARINPRSEFEAEAVHFENKLGYAVSAGLNIAVAPRLSLGVDARYAPYKAQAKGSPDTESIKLDPTTLSLGLRYRF